MTRNQIRAELQQNGIANMQYTFEDGSEAQECAANIEQVLGEFEITAQVDWYFGFTVTSETSCWIVEVL